MVFKWCGEPSIFPQMNMPLMCCASFYWPALMGWKWLRIDQTPPNFPLSPSITCGAKVTFRSLWSRFFICIAYTMYCHWHTTTHCDIVFRFSANNPLKGFWQKTVVYHRHHSLRLGNLSLTPTGLWFLSDNSCSTRFAFPEGLRRLRAK